MRFDRVLKFAKLNLAAHLCPRMADFAPIVDKILGHEGGFQNMPEDWGNYNAYTENGEYVTYSERPGRTLRAGTNFGITAARISSRLKRPVSESHMRNLTRSQAVQEYRLSEWASIKGDRIQNQQVAEVFFDGVVNHGKSYGTKLMQKALNAKGANLQVDGAVGELTLAALNAAQPAVIVADYLKYREAVYYRLADTRPGNDRFLKGWLKRLSDLAASVYPYLPSLNIPLPGGGNQITTPKIKTKQVLAVAAILILLVMIARANRDDE